MSPGAKSATATHVEAYWPTGYWPGGMSHWSPGDTWATEDLPFLAGHRAAEAPPPIARGVARRIGLRKPKVDE